MNPLALALLILTDAMALALVIRARAPWVLRALTIVVVLGVAFAIWSAASNDAGWPAKQPIPDRSTVLACVVDQPLGSVGGTIYFWLVPPSSSSGPLETTVQPGEPRAYAEPYSLGLDAACQQAQQMAKNGQQAAIRTHARGHIGGQHGPPTRFRIYQLPPPHPSPKG